MLRCDGTIAGLLLVYLFLSSKSAIVVVFNSTETKKESLRSKNPSTEALLKAP